MTREFMIICKEFSFGFHQVYTTSLLFLTLTLGERRKSVSDCLVGTITYGRKPGRIIANQVKRTNFHIGGSAIRCTRVKDGLPYKRSCSYGRSYEVPEALPYQYKTLSWRRDGHWRTLAATTMLKTHIEREREEIWRTTGGLPSFGHFISIIIFTFTIVGGIPTCKSRA